MGISPASKVAIAFIRPFRSYLDGHILLKDSKPKLEQDLKDKMEGFADVAKKNNPQMDQNRIDYAKECLIEVNMQMINACDPCYDKVLPSVIDELLLSLETELKKTFTDNELEEIANYLDKPLFKKLLNTTVLFGVLKKYELELIHKVRMEVFDSAMSENSLSQLKSMFDQFKKKHGISDQDIDEDEGDMDSPEDYLDSY